MVDPTFARSAARAATVDMRRGIVNGIENGNRFRFRTGFHTQVHAPHPDRHTSPEPSPEPDRTRPETWPQTLVSLWLKCEVTCLCVSVTRSRTLERAKRATADGRHGSCMSVFNIRNVFGRSVGRARNEVSIVPSAFGDRTAYRSRLRLALTIFVDVVDGCGIT